MKIRTCAREQQNELIKLRRTLHQIPELAFCEEETAAFLYEYLEPLLPDSLERIAKTGIKAVFYAKGATKTVAIRADMDALPITEQKGCPFQSKNAGAMHACGHDGHMAMALVTAKIVSENRDKLRVNYVFLFQPAEEAGGGAEPMIEAGALQNPDVDEIYGIHLWPYLPAGKVGLLGGPVMARMNDVNIDITGKGVHGARPQQGVDAIVAAAQLVLALQTIVSRNIDPFGSAVLTIGKIEGGDTRNVVPGRVHLEGTLRTLDEDTAAHIKRRICEVMQGIDTMYGTQSTSYETMMYPPVVNDRAMAEALIPKFSDSYTAAVPVMLSEDFSYYQKEVPGVLMFLGTLDDMHTEPLHSSSFGFDEKVLLHGVEYYLRATDFDEPV
ncbi:MAG: M20 metallopeptidase family protein [Christensenellaceae bacterium]|jgi:amidohydrolase